MTKDFELRGRFIFSKRILGLGVHFEIKPPYAKQKKSQKN